MKATDELLAHVNGIAKNAKDPLWKSAPERAHYLTNEFGRIADKFQAADVINAGGSILITVLRQCHPNRQKAEAAIDELFGRMKAKLLEHYDGAHKRKDGVFPFDQDLRPQLIVAKPKIITN